MTELRHFRHEFINHMHTLKLCLDVLERSEAGAHPTFVLEWLESLEASADGCIAALEGYYMNPHTILASAAPVPHGS